MIYKSPRLRINLSVLSRSRRGADWTSLNVALPGSLPCLRYTLYGFCSWGSARICTFRFRFLWWIVDARATLWEHITIARRLTFFWLYSDLVPRNISFPSSRSIGRRLVKNPATRWCCSFNVWLPVAVWIGLFPSPIGAWSGRFVKRSEPSPRDVSRLYSSLLFNWFKLGLSYLLLVGNRFVPLRILSTNTQCYEHHNTNDPKCFKDPWNVLCDIILGGIQNECAVTG